MTGIPRKKSPRAPSISLDEALERVMKIYDRERLHPASTDIIAQHLGYKSANNGTALGTLASLRYFGLLDRPKEGMLAVAKEVESYNFAPDVKLKRSLLLGFLVRPALYNELLEKYESGLPSDANLKYALIQRGFAPQAAEPALAVFKRSVSFADYYNGETNNEIEEDADADLQNHFRRLMSRKPLLTKGTQPLHCQQLPLTLARRIPNWIVFQFVFLVGVGLGFSFQPHSIMPIKQDLRLKLICF